MSVKEIMDIMVRFDTSHKGYTIHHKDMTVEWTDWNGENHIATTKDELWNQLMEAPKCQTSSQVTK